MLDFLESIGWILAVLVGLGIVFGLVWLVVNLWGWATMVPLVVFAWIYFAVHRSCSRAREKALETPHYGGEYE